MNQTFLNEDDAIFASLPPFFRAADRLRLEGYISALTKEGMSLSILSTHEAILDHYLNLLLARLRQAAPELTLEVYFPASSEALLARFNEVLSECSIQEAMAGSGTLVSPKIWIVHDASALPDHEVQLLARLVQNFPGANIRVILLMTVASQKQKLLTSFGRRILCWDVEPPTAEQAELMLQQANADGREFAVRSLLKKIHTPDRFESVIKRASPVFEKSDIESDEVELEPTLQVTRPKRLRVFLIAFFVLFLSLFSVLSFQISSVSAYFSAVNINNILARNLTTTEVKNNPIAPAIDPKVISPQLPASEPLTVVPVAASAIAEVTPPEVVKNKEVIEVIQPVNTEIKAVRTVSAAKEIITQEIPPPDLQIGQAWVKKMPRGTFLVQHVALPSVQDALLWVQKHPNLKNARVVATYLPNQKATQYSIVSGPFTSLLDATTFAESGGIPKDPMIRSARFMKEQFSPEQADADAKKRKESKR